MALTQRNHQTISEHFANKDTSTKVAIDATCGNGHDTLFLAKLGFKSVYGFDIQPQAIRYTQRLIEQEGLTNFKLIQAGHESMDQHITEQVDCILFNLGYLPGADKRITTIESTSISALDQALALLSEEGLLSILCYPGHEQGAIETSSIQGWLKRLKSPWQVTEILSSHPSRRAPILYIVK